MQKSFRRAQFRCGLRAGIPIVLGYVPVGIAYAILARQAGFTVRETCAMSLFVYAGASEMMAAAVKQYFSMAFTRLKARAPQL